MSERIRENRLCDAVEAMHVSKAAADDVVAELHAARAEEALLRTALEGQYRSETEIRAALGDRANVGSLSGAVSRLVAAESELRAKVARLEGALDSWGHDDQCIRLLRRLKEQP